MPRSRPQSIAQTFAGAKAEYAGMTESRFRRRRPGVNGVGGPGDWHYEAESRFVKMREYTRAMIRDDAAAKFLIERACDNIIGPGFRYEPNTGDDAGIIPSAISDRGAVVGRIANSEPLIWTAT